MLLVDGVNLNPVSAGGVEATADIETQILAYDPAVNAAGSAITQGYVCYTPLGHAFMRVDAAATPVFNGVLPSTAPLVLRVTRNQGGSTRDVLVPPNGMARLFSHT